MDAPVLHWFRVDLRARDNAALAEASRVSGGRVVGLYVVSPEDWIRHDDAPVKVRFMLRALADLASTLARLNILLVIRTANHLENVPGIVADLAEEIGATVVFANRQYEVDEAARDEAVAALLRVRGVRLALHHDQAIMPPTTVMTGAGTAYTVFTPFKKRWLKAIGAAGVFVMHPAPRMQSAFKLSVARGTLTDALAAFQSDVPELMWIATERGALQRLQRFAAEAMREYSVGRDRFQVDGTSVLSPYLTAGVISARECLAAALGGTAVSDFAELSPGAQTWVGELIWRDFYKQVLYHFPRVSRGRAFKPATERIAWIESPAQEGAWQAGRTGVPIVDAAMRALLATGWMHNRLRMVTAMYFCKDLFLDWRRGERWFMRHLIDGDLSQNNGGWQWCASVGTDAAPYFRIFNPVAQSRRFNPEGEYIRRWVPELATLGAKSIHDPSAAERSACGYPAPIAARDGVRERVVAAFRAIR